MNNGSEMNPSAASFSFNPGTTAFVPKDPPVEGAGEEEEAEGVGAGGGAGGGAGHHPPSANDLAAELAAMAAIARGETSSKEAPKEAPKEVSKEVSNVQKESKPEPVPAYTPEERAARKEKITATLAQIDAVRGMHSSEMFSDSWRSMGIDGGGNGM